MTWCRGAGVITEGKAHAGRFSFRFQASLQWFPSSLTLVEVLKSVTKQLQKKKKGGPTPLVITTPQSMSQNSPTHFSIKRSSTFRDRPVQKSFRMLQEKRLFLEWGGNRLSDWMIRERGGNSATSHARSGPQRRVHCVPLLWSRCLHGRLPVLYLAEGLWLW